MTEPRGSGFDDPELVAFAERARMVPLPARAGFIARFSDMELIDAVAERDGEFVLETSERGGVARPVVSSASLALVRRELVIRLGSAVRHRARLPRFDLPSSPDALPDGFELTDHGDQADLRWEQSAEPLQARFHGRAGARDAVVFAQLARLPEAELMAAYLDERPRPLR